MTDNMAVTPYSTSDTPLAAYLCTIGFQLKELTRNGKVYFVFDTTHELLAAVRAYATHSAACDPARYHEEYRKLLDKVRNG